MGMKGQNKIQDYSWGGISESRDAKKAKAHGASMQAGIDRTESKLEGLLQQKPGYNFSYGSNEFNDLRKQVASGGPLEHFQQARQLLKQKAGQNLDRQTSDRAGQQATAFSQLAMGGGLSSGARERVAQGGLQGNLMARQKLRGETQNQFAEIGGMEAKEKLGLQQKIADIAAKEDQRRQQMAQDRWKVEMETRASLEKSRQQANATASSNSCFAPGTMITMEDGTPKRIEYVEIGDRVRGGGDVYTTQVTKFEETCFHYDNKFFVTGSHAVYEDGRWLRVKDAKLSKPCPHKLSKVYNIGVEKHMIYVGDVLVSDLHETDSYEFVSDEKSLEIMNEEPLNEQVAG